MVIEQYNLTMFDGDNNGVLSESTLNWMKDGKNNDPYKVKLVGEEVVGVDTSLSASFDYYKYSGLREYYQNAKLSEFDSIFAKGMYTFANGKKTTFNNHLKVNGLQKDTYSYNSKGNFVKFHNKDVTGYVVSKSDKFAVVAYPAKLNGKTVVKYSLINPFEKTADKKAKYTFYKAK